MQIVCKASISLGYDKKATFQQVSHWGLTGNCDHYIYATVARISHNTRMNHWRISARVRVHVPWQSRHIRETLVRSSHDGIAIICHVRLRQDVLANVARLSCEGRANVARWLCEKMINREHIKFLQCFNRQSPMRWSLIKTKLILSELQHVYLQGKHEPITIHLRHSHDDRETFVRVSHDVHANVA